MIPNTQFQLSRCKRLYKREQHDLDASSVTNSKNKEGAKFDFELFCNNLKYCK